MESGARFLAFSIFEKMSSGGLEVSVSIFRFLHCLIIDAKCCLEITEF